MAVTTDVHQFEVMFRRQAGMNDSHDQANGAPKVFPWIVPTTSLADKAASWSSALARRYVARIGQSNARLIAA